MLFVASATVGWLLLLIDRHLHRYKGSSGH